MNVAVRRLGLVLAIVVAAACGQPAGHATAPRPRPSSASGPVLVTPLQPPPAPASEVRLATPPRIATAARVATLPGGPLVAVQYPGDMRAVHFFALDGREVLAVNIVDFIRFLGGVQGEPYFVDAQGYVSVIRRNGTSSLVLATGRNYAVMSPDLKSWAYDDSQWGSQDSSGVSIHSEVHVAGLIAAGTPGGDHIIAWATELNHSLRPYRWTNQGLWLTHGAVGIGGYILFNSPFGVADLVDPKTGAKLATADCLAFDRSADGTLACVHGNPQGSSQGLTLTITRPGTAPVTAALPAPNFNQAGDVMFLPGGSRVVVAGAIGNPESEHYETDVVDVATGKRTLWLDGYRPAFGPDSLLPDGRLIVTAAGDANNTGHGFGILGADGRVTMLTATGLVVGIVRG